MIGGGDLIRIAGPWGLAGTTNSIENVCGAPTPKTINFGLNFFRPFHYLNGMNSPKTINFQNYFFTISLRLLHDKVHIRADRAGISQLICAGIESSMICS